MPTTRPPEHLDAATHRRLERDFADLRNEFEPLLGPDVVEQCLQETLDRLTSGGGHNAFVPLLAQRFAHEQLRALAQYEGALDKTLPEVLFVCVHDAGRSQMAAAILAQRAEGAVHVRTAGITRLRTSTRSSRRSSTNAASLIHAAMPSRSPTPSCEPPTSSSRSAAPTRCPPSSARNASTGTSQIPTGSNPTRSPPSVMTSSFA